MSKKFSASRKRAFLTYLAQTGNQTLSAERARVSRSWVQLHRSTDAAFDAACREAIEVSDGKLNSPLPPTASRRVPPSPAKGGGASCGPPSGWGFLDGAELVVGGSNGRRTQVRRARLIQWTPRVEDRFLAALSATCNVRAACAEVGMHVPSAYAHRKRWRAFAQRWDEAVEEGQIRLEMALLQRGGNVFSDEELPEPCPITEMTAADAIALLKFRRGLERSGKWARWKYRPRSLDEVRDSILRKLEAMERFGELEEREEEKRKGGLT